MKRQGFFINNILSEEPSFKVLSDYLKTFSEIIKEDENMGFEKRVLDWWIDFNDIVYRWEDSHYRFENWLYYLYK